MAEQGAWPTCSRRESLRLLLRFDFRVAQGRGWLGWSDGVLVV